MSLPLALVCGAAWMVARRPPAPAPARLKPLHLRTRFVRWHSLTPLDVYRGIDTKLSLSVEVGGHAPGGARTAGCWWAEHLSIWSRPYARLNTKPISGPTSGPISGWRKLLDIETTKRRFLIGGSAGLGGGCDTNDGPNGSGGSAQSFYALRLGDVPASQGPLELRWDVVADPAATSRGGQERDSQIVARVRAAGGLFHSARVVVRDVGAPASKPKSRPRASTDPLFDVLGVHAAPLWEKGSPLSHTIRVRIFYRGPITKMQRAANGLYAGAQAMAKGAIWKRSARVEDFTNWDSTRVFRGKGARHYTLQFRAHFIDRTDQSGQGDRKIKPGVLLVWRGLISFDNRWPRRVEVPIPPRASSSRILRRA